MELDDLKENWKNSGKQYQTPGYNLNEVLTKQSHGPLSALKAKYQKQMVLLPIAAAILGITMTQKPILQHNAFIWFIIPVLLMLALMYYRDYRLIVKMEQTATESLKNSIQENVKLLNRNARQHLYFTRIILVLLVVTLEATMYYQATAAFNFWQGIALPVRLAVYALIFIVQPYVTRYFFNLSFGRYINRLEQLLQQTS